MTALVALLLRARDRDALGRLRTVGGREVGSKGTHDHAPGSPGSAACGLKIIGWSFTVAIATIWRMPAGPEALVNSTVPWGRSVAAIGRSTPLPRSTNTTLLVGLRVERVRQPPAPAPAARAVRADNRFGGADRGSGCVARRLVERRTSCLAAVVRRPPACDSPSVEGGAHGSVRRGRTDESEA